MRNGDNLQLKYILLRYVILLLIGLSNLYIFYLIFKPLTIYPVYFLLNIFSEVSLYGNVLSFANGTSIQLVNACIAGAAYYLLLILNLSTPNIKFNKRLKMIIYSFASLLILNILRIFILTNLFVSGFAFFDFTHKLFWYLLSIVFVIGIWFIQIKIYKIKEIPFYSDLKYFYKRI